MRKSCRHGRQMEYFFNYSLLGHNPEFRELACPFHFHVGVATRAPGESVTSATPGGCSGSGHRCLHHPLSIRLNPLVNLRTGKNFCSKLPTGSSFWSLRVHIFHDWFRNTGGVSLATAFKQLPAPPQSAGFCSDAPPSSHGLKLGGLVLEVLHSACGPGASLYLFDLLCAALWGFSVSVWDCGMCL